MPDPPQPRSKDQVAQIYRSPLLDLVYRAASIHRAHHEAGEVQICTLLSIKTGGCPENCSYCSQSAHFKTPVERQNLLDVDQVVETARQAKDSGSTRFCMGAAWRQIRDGKEFEKVLDMVRHVAAMDLEAC
jgi:biotin synthase